LHPGFRGGQNDFAGASLEGLNMVRKVAILTVGIVVLQVTGILVLGTSPAGSVLANSIEIIASWVAAGACYLAFRRARGLFKPFWFLIAAGLASWGFANLGWTYYEDYLRIPAPTASIIFFDIPGGFYAMALFLDEEKDSPRLNSEKLLDFFQVAIVVCFLYFDLFYVPCLQMAPRGALLYATYSLTSENIILVILSLIRVRTMRSTQLETTYKAFAVCLVFYAICAGVADYWQILRGIPTGTWGDLAWTLPFLLAAFFSTLWHNPATLDPPIVRASTLTHVAVNNLTYTTVPIVVVVMAARLAREWPLVSYSTIILSAGCYAARLALSQYRQMHGAHMLAARSAQLARANEELKEASLQDSLTGIRNRRFFQTTISTDASQVLRAYRDCVDGFLPDHRDLIFYLIDLDHFKEINDAYGHPAGDQVLVQVAQRLGGIVRKSDSLIRWGGEEFLIVCRSAERKDGTQMAERILSAVADAPFHLSPGLARHRTCSVGWAAFPWMPRAADAYSVDAVLKMADQGLYSAKRRGRNRAVGFLAREKSSVSDMVPSFSCGEPHDAQLLEIRNLRPPSHTLALQAEEQ